MPTNNEQDPTKAGETPAGGTEADKKVTEGSAAPTLSERELAQEKQIKALNEEAKKRRHENNELKERNERVEKAMKLLNGEGDPDPVAIEKKKADDRLRRAYLKSAFVSAAATDMHDADFAFGALEGQLKSIDVDLDQGTVDKAALSVKLGDIKKAQPFLFKPPAGSGPVSAPKSPPDGGGAPTGGDPFKHWQQLKSTPGREKEANDFYGKNRAQIAAHWPKG